ncbi:hypothetical protein R6Q57_003649 [Mikania cordata]
MACDLLTVQTFTVALKSAFALSVKTWWIESKSNKFEDEIELETRVLEDKVEERISPNISDDELAQEARTRKCTQTQ